MLTLVTGAAGYLGRSFVRHVLAHGDDEVIACLRAGDPASVGRRRDALVRELGRDARRVTFRSVDLTDEAPFAELRGARIHRIIHAAANTRFDVDRQHAEAVNVLGTVRVLELARSCRGLEKLALLGTVYSAGLAEGEIAEAPGTGEAGFANHYEWSKWRAEQAALHAYRDVPWQIHRIATVACDDDTGRIVQHNVIHQMWRLLYRGLLPVVPGHEHTPVYVVTGAFVTQAVWHLLQHAPAHVITHLCHDRGAAVDLETCVDIAYERFTMDASFRARGVLRPLFVDEPAFVQLADTAGMFSRDTLGPSIALLRPFSKQLFVGKAFQTERTAELLGASYRPDVRTLLTRASGRLLQPDPAQGEAGR